MSAVGLTTEDINLLLLLVRRLERESEPIITYLIFVLLTCVRVYPDRVWKRGELKGIAYLSGDSKKPRSPPSFPPRLVCVFSPREL